MLTGVPGSGKTLAGLHVVHNTIATGVEQKGDIVYLSGNTPLVCVLREALALDEHSRSRQAGRRISLGEIRLDVRARIQHINDFLQDNLSRPKGTAPHEHVIVFDEAQRAWDEKQGREKFKRTASEPTLLLEVMSRHEDWCACVCLVGSGQEINSGEEGVVGWGDALRRMPESDRKSWKVVVPPDVLNNHHSTDAFTLGELPSDLSVLSDPDLQLHVPQRSYRCPQVSDWVDAVLAGDATAARMLVHQMTDYPLTITRSLESAKSWLKRNGRGERRYGLVASSGARRLRADGLGVTLPATAGMEIAHWYLNPPDDIRSSYAMEVPANEYTCQGLELDFTCVCWGGDMLWNQKLKRWNHSRLSGNKWQRVGGAQAQRRLTNKYRVLLTRAREGTVLWIPQGEESDSTRAPRFLDDTAEFLMSCGATRFAGDGGG
jgi:hypothetical protein